MDKQPSYYAILTAEVRYDKRLSSSEKLFFAEVTALSNKTGECWASRRYFAELYGVTKRTITNWTNKLCELNYVDVDYEYSDSGEIKKRAIRIANTSGIHIIEGVKKTSRGSEEKFKGRSEENNRGGSEEKFTVNTTRENTTRNNTTRENTVLSETEQDALEVCEHLLSSITDSDPDHRYNSNPPDLYSSNWLKEIDRAIRLDGRTVDDLRHLISILYYDNNSVGDFWRSNVESGKKLRQHFDKIRGQLQRLPKYKQNNHDEFIDKLFA